jgi:hypothetical protein
MEGSGGFWEALLGPSWNLTVVVWTGIAAAVLLALLAVGGSERNQGTGMASRGTLAGSDGDCRGGGGGGGGGCGAPAAALSRRSARHPHNQSNSMLPEGVTAEGLSQFLDAARVRIVNAYSQVSFFFLVELKY